MKIVSLNVGLPREVTWHGQVVTTGIFKEPVVGRVALRNLNFDGDRQADLTVHGGEYKAVYCYPLSTTIIGKRNCPGVICRWEFLEKISPLRACWKSLYSWAIDFAVGTAEVVVTQPRLPCYKLGIRISIRRHGEAIAGQPAEWILCGSHAGGRSWRGRRNKRNIAG